MVRSTNELSQIEQIGNTIYLRKNISLITVEDTEGTHEEYEANETYFDITELSNKPTLQEIEDNFDIYWDWAKEKRKNERVKKQKAKRVKELVDEQYDLADMKEALDQLVIDNL